MGTRKGPHKRVPSLPPQVRAITWSVHMTSNAYRARTATATLAVLASGYLVMSGAIAEPAEGESSSEVVKTGESSPSWLGATKEMEQSMNERIMNFHAFTVDVEVKG